jgi:hypothetical protein
MQIDEPTVGAETDPTEEEIAAAIVVALATRAPQPAAPDRGWAGYWRRQRSRQPLLTRR